MNADPMQTWNYEATDAEGRRLKAVIHAADETEARRILERAGCEVHALKPRRSRLDAEARLEDMPGLNAIHRGVSGGRVRNLDLMRFLEEFRDLLRRGLSKTDALDLIAGKTKESNLRRALDGIRERLEAGAPLEEAFDNPRVFSPLCPAVLREGTRYAELPDVVDTLKGLMKERWDWRMEVKQILYRPAFFGFLALAALILGGLAISIVYNKTGTPLRPAIAWTLGFVDDWSILLLLLFFAFLAGLAVLEQTTHLQRINLRLFGNNSLYTRCASATVAHFFHHMTRLGLPVHTTLQFGQIGDRLTRASLERARERAEAGVPLEEIFADEPALMPLARSLQGAPPASTPEQKFARASENLQRESRMRLAVVAQRLTGGFWMLFMLLFVLLSYELTRPFL